jgi:ATP-dependent DNA helicase RecQ
MHLMEGFSPAPAPGTVEGDLRDRFGFEKFLPGQRELISAVLSGRDAFGLMPTGGGKSLTYQLPAVRLGGLTVVVSPLIALMKDQVDAFNRRQGGRALAVAIHSGMGRADVWEVLGHLDGGRASLLYVAPERLEFSAFRQRLKALAPKLLVIDEVHCVSLWGHDFRPSYMRLAGLIEELRPCPALGLTSTATPQARGDILQRLGLREPLVFLAPLDRPNLFFRAVRCVDDTEKKARLGQIVRKVGDGKPQIVYVGRRADAEQLAASLKADGIAASPYHAGMAADDRRSTQEDWLAGRKAVIVATVAFGMGIDNPHVRAVTHYQHPASIESYYQEAGRAGRDGQRADCTILFSPRDTGLHHYFIRNRYPERRQIVSLLKSVPAGGCDQETLVQLAGELSPEQLNVAMTVLLEQGLLAQGDDGSYRKSRPAGGDSGISLSQMDARKNADYRRLEAMERYCRETQCCRANLLRYLGEKLPPDYRCGNCSLCLAESHAPSGPPRRASSARGRAASATGSPDSAPGRAAAAGAGVGSVKGRRVRREKAETAGPGVFWTSPYRSFTMEELSACQVPRKIGLAILSAVAKNAGLLSPSGLANLLKGSRSSDAIKRAPALAEQPEFGAAAGDAYEALLQHVLAMLAKGYLTWAAEGRKRLALTSQGRKIIAPARA